MSERESMREGGSGKLPELLKSDDVTGKYKEATIVLKEKLPDKYQQAFNNAWNAVRMNKFKQFKTSVSNLIKFSSGTPAESAPLDVHCKKVTITFGDPEKKEEHLMCLLAWCGFHGRLEFAHHLIHKGANIDSGNQEVGSPLLQMMVLHDARPGAIPLSLEVMHFFTEDNCSVLSRVISTKDNTFYNATALTIALHMKRVDIAQYLYCEHKLHPVLCGSRHYPPLFVEYIEYGNFEFIPWLLTEGFECRAEIVRFIDEVSRPEFLEAGLMEGGEVKPGSLMEAASRNDRHVAHAMLLSTDCQAIHMFIKKRPDLIKAVDGRGRTALYIAAEVGVQKSVNILSHMCKVLLNVKDKSGVQPVMAAAKAGHINVVERLLFHALKGDTLAKKPEVVDQIKHCNITALTHGYHTYFEGFHCESVSAYELNALTLKLDDAGNTAAHVAVLKGREDMFKAILPLTTCKIITLLTMENEDGKTPLQLAVKKGDSDMFEVLPTKQDEFLREWKCFNDALLLYACYHGNVETVNAIMNLNSTAHTQSPMGRTPLSCAAETGNDEVVGYLLTCRHASSDGYYRTPSPEGSGVPEWSPLLLAAANGHAKVCRRLLEKRASVNIPRCPRTNFTPLMTAIASGRRDVVITILSDETQGSEAMRVCVAKNSKEGEETTPMRMLIEEMPDVAEWMMDRSIRTVDPEEEGGEELTEDSCEIEYSFQFLEDFQDETPMLPFSNFFKRSDNCPSRRGIYSTSRDPLTLDLHKNGSNRKMSEEDDRKNEKQQETESEILTTPCTADLAGTPFFKPTASNMDNIFDTPPPCPSLDEVAETLVRLHSHHENDWGPAQYNKYHHPLHIMVSHKRTELLKHPLVVRLLEYKWRNVVLPFLIAYIILYLVYLLLLTTFAMLSPRPSPESSTCRLTSRAADVIALKTNGTCNAIDAGTVGYLYLSSSWIFVMSLIYLSVEAVWLFSWRNRYITQGRIRGYVQVLMFVLSIIFVSGHSNECWCAPSWQWQIGALALFLAWFNLILVLKDLPFTGIPISMLFNICLTFVGLVFLPILLITSFSLPFYMLFVRDLNAIKSGPQAILNAFESPARAMAKTIMQTTGELDFSNIFNSGDLLYSPTTYILFITFVVIMPVLFSNLLIGLAVGDTVKVKDKAAFTRTKLQVVHILELEAMSAFLRGHMRPRNNRQRYGKRNRTSLHWWYRKIMGLDYNNQLEMVKYLRDKDEAFVNAALKEKGPTHELEVKVGGLSVKTVKVEEDVRAVREEMIEVKGKMLERFQSVEKSVSEIKALLVRSIKSKTQHAED